jgi:hypothetical protein
MSKRDRGLLEAAGLSVPDAALLLKRTRQAIYQGLSQNSSDYFTARDALFVLNDVKRKNSSRLEELVRFIDTNYSQADSEIILPGLVAHEQITQVLRRAARTIIVFNGNTENLAPTTTFARILVDLVSTRAGEIDFVMPGDWVIGYLEQNLGLHIDTERVTIDDKVAYLPSFIITQCAAEHKEDAVAIGHRRSENGAHVHAFFCARLSMEEVRSTDAERLWKYYEPMCEQKSGDKLRVAG